MAKEMILSFKQRFIEGIDLSINSNNFLLKGRVILHRKDNKFSSILLVLLAQIIIEFVEMAQCFRFQLPPQPSYHSHHPIVSLPLQSSQIDHLRRQNDFLRKQLEALMHMRQTSNRASHSRTPTAMCSTPTAYSSEDADEVYRNKLSKIKMRKSPRHQMEMNATIPNSPEKIGEFIKNREGTMVERKCIRGEMINRNEKMQAASGDRRQIFRDQTNFSLANAPRKHQIYGQSYNQSNTTAGPFQFNEHQTHRPPKSSHKRAGSSYNAPVDHNFPTNRLASNTQPPTERYPSSTPVGHNRLNSKVLISPHKNFRTSSSQNRQEATCGSCQSSFINKDKLKCMNTGSKRTFLAAEHSEVMNTGVYTKQGTQILSQGDSCLSIERNLCQAKQNRKLRCAIYLQEEPQL